MLIARLSWRRTAACSELRRMPAMLVPINQGKPIVLDKPIVLVGRHPDCDAVILNSRKISRKHCAIALVNNKFVVRDLGSMNGIWVNGERVEHQSPVNFGDELVIGDVAFNLQADKVATNGKAKPASANAGQETPLAPSKPTRQPAAVAARKPVLSSPQRADLSMEFPVPIEDEDDGFAVPPPKEKPVGLDTDAGEDNFIPLQNN